MDAEKKKTGIIMSGGGARAAYQVGVLKAISEILPADSSNPFDIICGTSAGAINAAALATHAYNYKKSVQRLNLIWSNFHAYHVFRTSYLDLAKTSMNWFIAMLTAGMSRRHGSLHLLDRAPLQKLLEQYIHNSDIQYSIDNNFLHALSISASGYTTQQSISFFQGHPSIQPWSRSRRCGARASITIEHLMASSAIPFIFSPIKINREFFGDGSMRQIAPISPALHLGAEKILVIGNRYESIEDYSRDHVVDEPSIGQIAGHALDSIFLDSLSTDIERLQRINKTVRSIPEHSRKKHNIKLREIDILVISPSKDLGKIAQTYTHELPASIRFLLRSIGASRQNKSSLVSYLLFEKSYCRALIDLGYQDAMQQQAQLTDLLKN